MIKIIIIATDIINYGIKASYKDVDGIYAACKY